MSLDKAIRYGKEKRIEYRDARAFDSTCRNHKGCPIHTGNRAHFDRVHREAADAQLSEYFESVTYGVDATS